MAEAQLQEQMKKMEDPVIQHQQKELELKQAQLEAKMKTDAARDCCRYEEGRDEVRD